MPIYLQCISYVVHYKAHNKSLFSAEKFGKFEGGGKFVAGKIYIFVLG